MARWVAVLLIMVVLFSLPTSLSTMSDSDSDTTRSPLKSMSSANIENGNTWALSLPQGVVTVDDDESTFFAGRGPWQGGGISTVAEMFLAKYDVNGSLVWMLEVHAKASSGSKVNTAELRLDSQGRIYVIGSFHDPNDRGFDFGPHFVDGKNMTEQHVFDTWLARVSVSSEGVPSWDWVTTIASSGGDSGMDLIISSNDRVFASGVLGLGWSESPQTVLFGERTVSVNATNTSAFIAEVTQNGTWNWTWVVEDGSSSFIRDISITPDNQLLAIGDVAGTASFLRLQAQQGGDEAKSVLILELSMEGELTGVRNPGGAPGTYGYGVSISPSGQIFLTIECHRYKGNDFLTFGGDDIEVEDCSDRPYLIFNYSRDDQDLPFWEWYVDIRMNQTGIITTISFDSLNNMVFGVDGWNNLSIDRTEVAQGGEFGGGSFIVRLNPDGDLVEIINLSTPEDDDIYDVRITNSGAVMVSGGFCDTSRRGQSNEGPEVLSYEECLAYSQSWWPNGPMVRGTYLMRLVNASVLTTEEPPIEPPSDPEMNEILNLHVTNITTHSATINWNTTIASNSSILCVFAGFEDDLMESSNDTAPWILDEVESIEHSMTLTTSVHFLPRICTVRSGDVNSSSGYVEDDVSFQTLAPPRVEMEIISPMDGAGFGLNESVSFEIDINCGFGAAQGQMEWLGQDGNCSMELLIGDGRLDVGDNYRGWWYRDNLSNGTLSFEIPYAELQPHNDWVPIDVHLSGSANGGLDSVIQRLSLYTTPNNETTVTGDSNVESNSPKSVTSSPDLPLATIGAVSGAAIAGIGLSAIIRMEAVTFPIGRRWWLVLSMMGVRGRQPNGERTRGRIIGYLTANQGAHLRQLRRELNISSQQAALHLKILVDEDEIWHRRDGNKVRFYTSTIGKSTPSEDLPIPTPSLDENGMGFRLLTVLNSHSGSEVRMNQTRIAEVLEISRQLADYHLKSLIRLGLVESNRSGFRRTYDLTSSGAEFLLTSIDHIPQSDFESFDDQDFSSGDLDSDVGRS